MNRLAGTGDAAAHPSVGGRATPGWSAENKAHFRLIRSLRSRHTVAVQPFTFLKTREK
jgi:hypothetical protein